MNLQVFWQASDQKCSQEILMQHFKFSFEYQTKRTDGQSFPLPLPLCEKCSTTCLHVESLKLREWVVGFGVDKFTSYTTLHVIARRKINHPNFTAYCMKLTLYAYFNPPISAIFSLRILFPSICTQRKPLFKAIH